jgi:hypothetical protein
MPRIRKSGAIILLPLYAFGVDTDKCTFAARVLAFTLTL